MFVCLSVHVFVCRDILLPNFKYIFFQRLLVKLMGIDGQVHSWIKHFLKDRKQRVCVDGELSEWITVESGVPQGSVLGPILFVIYINDLPCVVDSDCIMFADDTKIYSSVNSNDQIEKLQKDIYSLSEWSDKWQLRFNADKCKVLHLGRENQKHVYQMKKHGSNEVVELHETKLEKDLGVFTDNELKFSTHVEKQVKGNQLLGLIRRSFQFLDVDTMKLLFVAIVRPHLEFGNAAWAPRYERDKELLEGVQRRAKKDHTRTKRLILRGSTKVTQTSKFSISALQRGPHRNIQIHSWYIHSLRTNV